MNALYAMHIRTFSVVGYKYIHTTVLENNIFVYFKTQMFANSYSAKNK